MDMEIVRYRERERETNERERETNEGEIRDVRDGRRDTEKEKVLS